MTEHLELLDAKHELAAVARTAAHAAAASPLARSREVPASAGHCRLAFLDNGMDAVEPSSVWDQARWRCACVRKT
jgi:hypothetical protein